ncbi:MAG: LptA/OstA family protein [Desulfobacterales bacterium]|nr:LptA/OstA family protein [Desulfobacterales bacterium]
MRLKIFNPIVFKIFICLLTGWLISAAWLSVAYAETQSADETAPANNKLHIRADKLVSLRESNYIQFTGNVEVDMSDATIKSNKLRIFYEKGDADESAMAAENIEKVVAIENVRINMENRTAHCDKAVYHPEKQVLVLTGKTVEIKSENNVVSGSKITFNQKTGEIIVDGAPEQRVNAIIRQIEKRRQTKPEANN